MKLENVGVGYDANFKPKSVDFSIGNPATIIRLLRDKLYSDKLRVCIQEYISNARDANREAGQPDHRIDITLPTSSAPIFRVRDYGPGLSEERVLEIFTKFGSSTKQGSDEFTGGFGIGAKSGWAYTDSFLVKSFHKGQERHYLCHLGGSPSGQMDLVYNVATDQPNGVEIELQIKAADAYSAFQNVLRCTHLWPQHPNILNIKDALRAHNILHNLTVLVMHPESTQWYGTEPKGTTHLTPILGVPGVYRAQYKIAGSDLSICVDGIPYEVTDAWISKGSPSGAAGSTVLMAKTGEVDVSASRESLEKNNKLEHFLRKKRSELSAAAWKECERLRKELDITTELPPFLKPPDKSIVWCLEEDLAAWTDRASRFRDESNKRMWEKLKTMDSVICTRPWSDPPATTKESTTPEPPAPLTVKEALMKVRLLVGPLTLIDTPWFYLPDEKIIRLGDRLYPLTWGPTYTIVQQLEEEDQKIYRYRRRRYSGVARPHFRSGFVEDPRKYYPLFGTRDYFLLCHNDRNDTHEQVRRHARRLDKKYTSVAYIQPMTKKLAAFIPNFKDHLKPVERRAYPRVEREPTKGSYRTIRPHSYLPTVTFGDYQEAGELGKVDTVVYRHPKQQREEWEQDICKLFPRVLLNGLSLLHVPERTLSLLQQKNPKVKFIDIIDWIEEWQEKPLTEKECEALALRWLDKSMCGNLYNLHAATLGIRKNLPSDYADYILSMSTQNSIRQNIGDWPEDRALSQKLMPTFDLSKTKVYKDRMKILKKYPFVLMAEQMLARTRNHDSKAYQEFSKKLFSASFQSSTAFVKIQKEELLAFKFWKE